MVGHSKNRDLLGSKILGEEPDTEPALHGVLRVLLRTSNINECIAADYVFKCFCEVVLQFLVPAGLHAQVYL